MHIAEATHEQGATARVFTYSGEYEQRGDQVHWRARAWHDDLPPVDLSGALPLSAAASQIVAEQAVIDAVVRAIDALPPVD